jgi:hypothetical protein
MEKRSSDNKGNSLYILTIILILAGFTGCQKAGTNCLTSAGSVIKENRVISDFDSINVGDYVNLFLTQDSVNRVMVESGENIIDGITTEINDHLLVIRNINTCNWLRSYNVPVNVYISVKNLRKVFYEASGNISSTNTINSENFTVLVSGGCGTIDLDMNVNEGYFRLEQGTVDFKLHGHCSISTIYAGDFGFFDCKDLSTGYSFVTNSGSNDCYVKVLQYLEANINSIGNIYYTGTPDTIITNINGSGQVIHY